MVSSADIVSRLGNSRALQLTTDSGATVDTAMIDTIIAQVEAVVWGFVRKRVALPLTQADYPQTYAALQGLITDMVVFRLHGRRPPVPEDVKLLHTQAVEWLNGLARGDVALPDATLNEPELDWDGDEQNAGTARGL